MRWSVLAVVLAACGGDDSYVELIEPTQGATISTGNAVGFRFVGHGFEQRMDVTVLLDGQVSTNQILSNMPDQCDGCEFVVGWAVNGVANGPHTIRLLFEYDLSTYAEAQVDLVFAF